MGLTPIQQAGDYWLKRDDLWEEQGVARGGKSRTAGLICRYALANGIKGICSANDRNSSIPGMLSRVCRYYGIILHLFYPEAASPLPGVFQEAESNGAILHPIKAGYMSVRMSRMRVYAADNGLISMGVGLAYKQIGVEETGRQLQNVPIGIKRIVVPVGSGGMLKGIIHGMENGQLYHTHVQVLGVCVGKPPAIILPEWAKLIKAPVPFAHEVAGTIGNVELDPVYEAKCLSFLSPGDLLWIVAHRNTE